jgi:hypothetical protein
VDQGRSEDDAGDQEAGDEKAPAFDWPGGQPISDARHCGLRPDFVLFVEVSHQYLLWSPVFPGFDIKKATFVPVLA